MTKRIYDSKNVKRAQELRKNMTRQEKKLWYEFLSSYPIRFYKQKPFGKYIVDFYCSKAKLAIELDGGQHYTDEGMEYDRRRSEYLRSIGIKVIRFSNQDIDQRFREVCEIIEKEIRNGITPSGAEAPPSPEGTA